MFAGCRFPAGIAITTILASFSLADQSDPSRAAQRADRKAVAAIGSDSGQKTKSADNADSSKPHKGRRHGRRGAAYDQAPQRPAEFTIDAGQRAQLVLTFHAGKHARGGSDLPHGVTGIEIWSQVGGTAPTSPATMKRVAISHQMTYALHYDGDSAGKQVWYAARFVNARGAGPFGRISSATVAR